MTFNDDGTKVVGSDWTGKVFVWNAKSGQSLGELEANPPTLNERVRREVQRIAALATQSAAAQTKQLKLETDTALANESLARVTQDLAATQALVAASTVAVRPATVAPPDVADSPPPPAPHPGEEAQRLKTAVEELKNSWLSVRNKPPPWPKILRPRSPPATKPPPNCRPPRPLW